MVQGAPTIAPGGHAREQKQVGPALGASARSMRPERGVENSFHKAVIDHLVYDGRPRTSDSVPEIGCGPGTYTICWHTVPAAWPVWTRPRA